MVSIIGYAFYRFFVTGHLYETTTEMAEMVKLAENSFRDINIAFAYLRL